MTRCAAALFAGLTASARYSLAVSQLFADTVVEELAIARDGDLAELNQRLNEACRLDVAAPKN